MYVCFTTLQALKVLFLTFYVRPYNSLMLLIFSTYVCLGDFNVNFDNESHPLFSDLSTLFCLSQIVDGPTHTHHNGSVPTIDLVLCLITSTYTAVKPFHPWQTRTIMMY